MENNVPKPGDIIYIDSSFHSDDFAGRDRVGGKVTVDRVTEENGKVWVTPKEFPTSSYNWESLREMQEYLKEQFGDSWAH